MSYKNRANFKPLSEFINRVSIKNKDGAVNQLKGININKFFMPSVANVIGTDLTKYKVVKPQQFACNRMHVGRDYRLPVSLSKFEYNIIVSPAYDVFEIIDTTVLDPEYLMMWFSRSEFDRNCWFYTDTDVRGKLGWDSLCEIELPIPSIAKQQEIVKEYNTVVNRITLNETLNQKLEETAQALYKHWFVDFEFPNEEGKPYKFSGGEMVFNSELSKDIPLGWEVKPFTKIVSLLGGGTPSTINSNYWGGEIPFFTPKDISKSYYTTKTEKNITISGLNNCSSKLYEEGTTFVTARGTVGAIGLASEPMAMNQSCYAIKGKENIGQFFAHQLTIETIKSLKEEATGAVFKALVTRDFEGKSIIEPPHPLLKKFEEKVTPFYKMLKNRSIENQILFKTKNLLLSRMTKVEVKEEM